MKNPKKRVEIPQKYIKKRVLGGVNQNPLEFIVMPLKEEDWKVVKGEYKTPEACPWCGGPVEEKLLEVKFLDGKVRISKFPKMVCRKCGRSFMNDEQASYYEKLQEDLVQVYSIEYRKRELQMVEA